MNYLNYLFFIIILISCKPKKRIEINDTEYAIGKNITSNNFQGEVKYYEKNTNRLKTTAFFKDNKIFGVVKKYDVNGSVYDIMEYENNLPNGYHYTYTNKLISYLDYYYYGLYVGPRLYFANGFPTYYQFTNFNRDVIFHVEYNNNKVIKKTGYPINFSISYSSSNDSSGNKLRLLLYNVNPPKIRIDHGLFIIDTITKNDKRITDFHFHQMIFKDTLIDIQDLKTEKYFIKTIYFDSTNNYRKEYISFLK